MNEMRDPKRIPKILARLRKIWEANPDLRLGQLIENVYPNTDYDWISSYQVEDEDFIRSIESYYKSNPTYRKFGPQLGKRKAKALHCLPF
jgi:hypothetical protein